MWNNLLMISLIFAVNYITVKNLDAQEIVIQESIDDDMFSRDRGPNGKHYFTSFLRFTVPISQSDEWAVKSFGVIGLDFGGRYKRRICEFYSTGLDLYLSRHGYALKQVNKIKPYDLLDKWDKERILVTSLGGVWYHRINFNRRGNYLGRYLDLGIYCNLYLQTRRRLKGEHDSIYIKAVDKSRDLLSKSEYGIQAGIGFNTIKLFGQYRVNHNINKIHSEIDLPKLRFGLEIDLTG